MTDWMYNWWGKEDRYTFDSVKCFMKHSLQKDILPKTYGLFSNGRIIGMFQFTYEDLEIRPYIYPWLTNLYVDEGFRNRGVGRILLEKIREIAKIEFKELYLYTEHIGLYEKFGWEYVSQLDTYVKSPRVQRLYKLNLK